MIMLTNTDTSISANYRDEQRAFFSAKAGMEEVRDRFRNGAADTLAGSLPTALPGNANAFVYVTNPNNGENVTPWITNSANPAVYPDTEICTELANMGNACTPGGGPYAGWYNPASGALPLRFSATYQMTPKAD